MPNAEGLINSPAKARRPDDGLLLITLNAADDIHPCLIVGRESSHVTPVLVA